MNTDSEGTITSFEEKPKKPRSTLASMGIYIFTYADLKKYLKADSQDQSSDNDFGKNIIPAMIGSGEKLIAYRFDGYWKDVGTVESYWEANMDLLKADNEVKLFQNDWKLYTVTGSIPSQYIGPDATLKDSLISEGCVIMGEVEHSVIFPGVTVGRNSRVVDSIVMEGCKIEENVIVNKSILLEGVTVRSNNAVGDGSTIAVIEEGRELSGGGFMK
jgi:glucose-1-phosphate adenylyltransferase